MYYIPNDDKQYNLTCRLKLLMENVRHCYFEEPNQLVPKVFRSNNKRKLGNKEILECQLYW